MHRMLIAGIFAAGALLAACESEGPAEKAGERIDEAVESTGEKLEEAGDTAREKVEEATDAIEEAADRARDQSN